jgi:hypothetical protein
MNRDRREFLRALTNVVIEAENERRARVRSKGLAVNADGTAGSVVYDDVVERRAADWRITYRKVSARREPLHG